MDLRNTMAFEAIRIIDDVLPNIKNNENQFNLDEVKSIVLASLAEMDYRKLMDLYYSKQLRFYITRMLCNQLFSKTSPYYYLIKKPSIKNEEINDDLI